uniref:B30.2/SPRY domain-containing protein n=1 Tax=Erpetoichthys calabaricus TaxID=27687 RepID=A0A8C4SY74_ERPCA
LFSATLCFVLLSCPLLSPSDVTFDPETAHPYLIVSEDGKEVRGTDIRQRVTDNPKRFDRSPCVMAREGFTSGRHYWEVEVGGKTEWTLGVARESINRKGGITLSPDDGLWTVWLRNENEYAALIGRPLHLPLRVKPQTVGVFLDYDEGQVSFYNGQPDHQSVCYYETTSQTNMNSYLALYTSIVKRGLKYTTL